MKKNAKNIALLGCLLVFFSCMNDKKNTPLQQGATDIYFGKEIKDPYRYLENTTDSSIVQLFKEKTTIANQVLDRLPQGKISMREENTTAAISNLRVTVDDVYFYLKTDVLSSTKKLHMRFGVNGEEEIIFDPDNFKAFKDKAYSINYYAPNRKGDKVVISLTKDDNEISTMFVFDVKSEIIISDFLKNCWPSALGGVRWLPDDSGFTYEYIPEVDKHSKEYLLDVETVLYDLKSEKRKMSTIFSRENNPEIKMVPEDFPEVNFKSENSDYMFANVSGASSYADYYYAPLNQIRKDTIKWKALYTKKDLVKTFKIYGDDIIFVLAKNAPNYKICKTSLNEPNINDPEILVGEDDKAIISDIVVTSKGIFFVKTINGVDAKLYQLQNKKVTEVPLPKSFGYINVISKGYKFEDLWIETNGWTSVKQRYRFNFSKSIFELENLIEEESPLSDDMVSEEIEVISHDGAIVPLSIIYKKGTKKDKSNRLLITAYGAYKNVYKPKLNKYIEEWVNNIGGIYAVAHVRGGGEKGNDWYKGGFKSTKPNSWKDLIACTEYFIKENYTTTDKIAVLGRSAGGITIGRAITERPDLYQAAAICVGVLNTTRFEFGPNGKNNTKEFGTVTDSLEVKYLYDMDAYQHISKGVAYPAAYITAGINDSRVPAWQPAKFAFRLEDATSSNRPVLLDIDVTGGHGLDASSQKKDDELRKIISFFLWQTGHLDYQPKN